MVSLSTAVFLDHHDGQTLHGLVGGKALMAGKTLPAAADAGTLFSGTGIDDFAFKVGTERTSHGVRPPGIHGFMYNFDYYTTLKCICVPPFLKGITNFFLQIPAE
jgi:hypothetical protein